MDVRKLIMGFLAVFVLGLAVPAIASAVTYTVDTTADTNAVNPAVSPLDSSGKISLRSAIEALNTSPGSGDLIKVPAGTYTLTSSGGAGQGTAAELLLSDPNGVTISGAGSSSTSVDANFLDRAFEVSNGATVTISRLTIENGRPGPDLHGGNATTCPATAPSTGAPGGAILDQGTLTLTNDTFTNNMSAGSGGAVEDNSSNPLMVSGSTFTSNNACDFMISSFMVPALGGAIDESGGSMGPSAVTVDSSTISGNAAQGDGGGVAESFSGDPATITITNSTVSGNQAGGEGGGIDGLNGAGSISLSADLISGNTAQGDGGGVGGNDQVSVVNSTITGNTANGATGGGGGIENAAHPVMISFSTINANTAPNGLGGNLLNGDSASFTLDNSIVTGGVDKNGSPDNCAGAGGGFTSLGYNLFDNSGAAWAHN